MRIICWQTILIKYHTLFFRELGKLLQTLSSAAVVIGALRVKQYYICNLTSILHHGTGSDNKLSLILCHLLLQ